VKTFKDGVSLREVMASASPKSAPGAAAAINAGTCYSRHFWAVSARAYLTIITAGSQFGDCAVPHCRAIMQESTGLALKVVHGRSVLSPAQVDRHPAGKWRRVQRCKRLRAQVASDRHRLDKGVVGVGPRVL
jgi:hypothetical protein